MSVVLVVSWLVTVLGHLSRVEVFQSCQAYCCLHVFVSDKLTVVQRYQRQQLIHLLLSVVGIHVICCYFVLRVIVSNYPVASRGQKANAFNNVTENMIIDQYFSWSCLLIVFRLRFSWFFLFLYGCRGGLVSKYIVFFISTWTWFFAWSTFTFVTFIIIPFTTIFNHLDVHFFFIFIVFYFCHETHINKGV